MIFPSQVSVSFHENAELDIQSKKGWNVVDSDRLSLGEDCLSVKDENLQLDMTKKNSLDSSKITYVGTPEIN